MIRYIESGSKLRLIFLRKTVFSAPWIEFVRHETYDDQDPTKGEVSAKEQNAMRKMSNIATVKRTFPCLQNHSLDDLFYFFFKRTTGRRTCPLFIHLHTVPWNVPLYTFQGSHTRWKNWIFWFFTIEIRSFNRKKNEMKVNFLAKKYGDHSVRRKLRFLTLKGADFFSDLGLSN